MQIEAIVRDRCVHDSAMSPQCSCLDQTVGPTAAELCLVDHMDPGSHVQISLSASGNVNLPNVLCRVATYVPVLICRSPQHHGAEAAPHVPGKSVHATSPYRGDETLVKI